MLGKSPSSIRGIGYPSDIAELYNVLKEVFIPDV